MTWKNVQDALVFILGLAWGALIFWAMLPKP